MRFLILGNGWLGNKFYNYLTQIGENSILVKDRIEERNTIRQLRNLMKEYSSEIVINCIGKTGRPNVDWCESHKEDTFFSNVAIPTMLAEVCESTDKYLVHIGSGCIFEGDNDGEGFDEYSFPNFRGSFYSKSKIFAEDILMNYRQTLDPLEIRIRMPIDCMPSKRNLITKLVGYEKVVSVPNSVTIIPDLLVTAKKLIDMRVTGMVNVVNSGAITHKEILQMYKAIVDPEFEMPEFISIEELNKITTAGRSNCILKSERLEGLGIKIRDVHESLRDCLLEYRKIAFN